jgi:outer membrane protein TolC
VNATEALTWKACLAEVAKNNAELRAASENLHSTEAAKKAALSGFLPQVNGSLGYSYGTGTSSGSGAQLAASSPNGSADGSYTASLSASQNLFSGFQDSGKVDQAAANQRVSAAQLDVTKAKVASDLKSAYAGVLFSQRSISLQRDVSRRREENLRLVELRFQSGGENKGSVLLSRAYLAQAKYDELQSKNNIRVSRLQLARILGRDGDFDFEVVDDMPLETLPLNPDLKKLAVMTPEHVVAVGQEEAAVAAVTIARAGFYPSFSLSATASRLGKEWFPQTERWSIGAAISIPIFTGGKDYYGTQGAIATRTSAEASRMNVGRQLLVKLEQTYSGYLEASEKLKVDESFREAALKRAEIARGKYNNGLMSFDDWDVIENDLIVRERAVLQSQKDRAAAEAAWAQALGKGVTP